MDKDNSDYEEWDEGTLAYWAQGIGVDPKVHLREMDDRQLDGLRQDLEALLFFVHKVQEERTSGTGEVIEGRFT